MQGSLITVGSGNSSSGSTTKYSGSSPKSRTTSPPPRAPSLAFDSPLQRDAGLTEEEEEYMAAHGHQRVDVDEDVDFERALSREEEAQAEEAPAPSEGGREREKRRIREEDLEVAAQRLHDVSNQRIWVACVSVPLSIPTSSIFCLPVHSISLLTKVRRTRPTTNPDRY